LARRRLAWWLLRRTALLERWILPMERRLAMVGWRF
jgi:hypothetical protein